MSGDFLRDLGHAAPVLLIGGDRSVKVGRYHVQPATRGACEVCERKDGVQLESSRTAYHWEGALDDPNNPNAPILLCRDCARDHHAYWDDMWDEYRRGLL